MTVGEKISFLARNMGKTQQEIAKEIKKSRISINRFFRGRTNISASDLMQILSVIGIEVDEILNERMRIVQLAGAQHRLEEEAVEQ